MESKFDEIVKIEIRGHSGKKEKKYTFRNSRTGKLCKYRFDVDLVGGTPRSMRAGRQLVKVGKKWAIFNTNTGKIYRQQFTAIKDLYSLLPAIKIDDKWAFLDLRTEKLLKQRFDDVYECDDLALVKTKGTVKFFNPSTQHFYKKEFKPEDISREYIDYDGIFGEYLEKALMECPEDFEYLPTSIFKYEGIIQKYLDAIAKGVKGLCSQKGSTKEAEEYAQGIYELISQKIEKEKQNIALADEAIAKEQQEIDEKLKTSEKAAQSIRELGKNLGGKE